MLLTLLTSAIPSLAYDFTVDGLNYSFTEDGQSVTVVGGGVYNNGYTIIIPDEVTYAGNTYPVVAIGNRAFQNKEILSLSIGSNVVEIGDYAFNGCKYFNVNTMVLTQVKKIGEGAFSVCGNLTFSQIKNTLQTIKLNGAIEEIGESAFAGCTALRTLDFTGATNLKSIGGYAFSGCTNLSTINIGDINSLETLGQKAFQGTQWYNNVLGGPIYFGKYFYEYKGAMPNNTNLTIEEGTLGIAPYAFDGKSGLTSITIPNSVKFIGECAFQGCSGLTSFEIPSSTTKVSLAMLQNCTGLTELTIPNTVTSIGNSAFNGCTGLKSVSIPTTITLIEAATFSGCSGLTSISIPSSVTSIGNSAFSGCSGLTSLNLSNSLQSIANDAFRNCSNVKTLTFNASQLTDYSALNSLTGVETLNLGNNLTSLPNSLVRGFTNLINISLGTKITSIEDNAFKGLSKLQSVNLKSVKTIGKNAFDGCTGLESISLPNTVNSIGEYVFNGCTNLNNVTLSTGLSKISRGAFSKCTSLPTITIPENISAIETQAFKDCSGLTSIEIPNSVTVLSDSLFYNCTSLSTVTLNAGLTDIGDYTFYQCGNLSKITIPNTIKNIGSYAFGNSGLSAITIPNGVTSIGAYAFNTCSNLTSATLPNSLTIIPNRIFENCSALSNVKLGNAVTEIGYASFKECAAIKSLTLPSTLTTIGEYAFQSCTGLTSMTIPAKVTTINNYAFSSCHGLTNLTISNSVETIGDRAFSGCYGLTSMTIPANLTSLGTNAFSGCSGVTTLNYRAKALTNPSNLSGMYNVETINFDGGATVVPANLLSYTSKINLVNIGKDVTTIESNAFNNCNFATLNYNAANCETGELNMPSLKTLIIGTDVKSIPSQNAFYNCTELEKIVLNPTTPPTLGNYNVFPFYKYLAIPKNLASAYQSNKDFKGRVLPLPLYDLKLNVGESSGNYYARSNGTTEEKLTYTDAGFMIYNKKVKATYKSAGDNSIYFSLNTIPDLIPGRYYEVQPYIVVDGTEYTGFAEGLTTSALQSNYTTVVAPSSVILDDATTVPENIKFKSATLTLDNKTYESYGNSIIVTGLRPRTSYNGTYSVEISEGEINSTSVYIYTPELSLKTQPVTMLTNSAALLQSTTNLSEEETSCGFLWKRYDAPEEMLGNPVYCPVYDGMMMGTLKNLPEGNYYKYRSFYKSTDGTLYYGDWVAFYTGDATVEFEPVAHTYNNARVSGNNAIIQGIALRGSKDITEQGFEYWVDNSAQVGIVPLDSLDANKLKASASSVSKINATGERMSATLESLQAGKTYLFRAFVKTAAGTTYGELRSFIVPQVEVNGDINADGSVNAGDVGALYKAVLNGLTESLYDLNGDGSVNAGDVGALYKIILGQ